MKKKYPVLYWIPRSIAILYILLISLFALDSESILGMLIHLIPTLLLIGITFIAWKWESPGGIIFILLGFLFTSFFHTYRTYASFIFISVPLFIIGILFLAHFLYSTSNQTKSKKVPTKKRKKRK